MAETCAVCGAADVTESVEDEVVPYGEGDDTVTVRVPVLTCSKCEAQYTDYRASLIRDAAVRERLGPAMQAPLPEESE